MLLICYNCGTSYDSKEDNVMIGSMCICGGGYLFEVDLEQVEDIILDDIGDIE